jgi:hypothetical protein
MNPSYQRTQIGWAAPALGIGLTLFAARLFYIVPQSRLDTGAALLFYVPVGLAVLYMVNFSAMTVSADDNEVFVAFGPGLVSFRFPMREIRAARLARNPWHYGWGVLRRGSIRIYSVGFGPAVELETVAGTVRIGSADAARLLAFIDQRLVKP